VVDLREEKSFIIAECLAEAFQPSQACAKLRSIKG
jgi:hypothetical protein